MDLSDEDVKEFVDLWEAEFGERLSLDVGRTQAKRLLGFFVTLANANLRQRDVVANKERAASPKQNRPGSAYSTRCDLPSAGADLSER